MAAEAFISAEQNRSTLDQALSEYSRRYMAGLVPTFRAASQIRRLFRIPRFMRTVTARTIQWSGIGRRLVLATR
jgi:hypothetical protein